MMWMNVKRVPVLFLQADASPQEDGVRIDHDH